jgi:hypothetical protein
LILKVLAPTVTPVNSDAAALTALVCVSQVSSPSVMRMTLIERQERSSALIGEGKEIAGLSGWVQPVWK